MDTGFFAGIHQAAVMRENAVDCQVSKVQSGLGFSHALTVGLRFSAYLTMWPAQRKISKNCGSLISPTSVVDANPKMYLVMDRKMGMEKEGVRKAWQWRLSVGKILPLGIHTVFRLIKLVYMSSRSISKWTACLRKLWGFWNAFIPIFYILSRVPVVYL